MFEKIVVPLDGSTVANSAVGVAASIARASAAPLEILSFVTYEQDPIGRESFLRAHVGDLGDLEAQYKIIQLEGDAAQALVGELNDEPGDLLVMTTRGVGRMGAVLGSVAETVVRDAHHPILIVGPHVAADCPAIVNGRLVAFVDGSEAAETSLPIATQWALAYGMTPSIAQVIDLGVTDPAYSSDTEYVGELADRYTEVSGHQFEHEVIYQKDAADAIVGHLDKDGAALGIMTTHCRTGIARFVLGSVAMRVVHQAPCPILLSRPVQI
ncbi:MAG: universal stress protein [Actinomycetia bacterium]|nr:universal stress protein [Actinomycetes bacterium]